MFKILAVFFLIHRKFEKKNFALYGSICTQLYLHLLMKYVNAEEANLIMENLILLRKTKTEKEMSFQFTYIHF